jgi:hypothetical protein
MIRSRHGIRLVILGFIVGIGLADFRGAFRSMPEEAFGNTVQNMAPEYGWLAKRLQTDFRNMIALVSAFVLGSIIWRASGILFIYAKNISSYVHTLPVPCETRTSSTCSALTSSGTLPNQPWYR